MIDMPLFELTGEAFAIIRVLIVPSTKRVSRTRYICVNRIYTQQMSSVRPIRELKQLMFLSSLSSVKYSCCKGQRDEYTKERVYIKKGLNINNNNNNNKNNNNYTNNWNVKE